MLQNYIHPYFPEIPISTIYNQIHRFKNLYRIYIYFCKEIFRTMEKILKLRTIDDYNKHLGVRTLHPLVGVIDFTKMESMPHGKKEYGFYCIYLKELLCGTMEYGRSQYDYQEGTLVFIAPGQTAGVNDGEVTLNPKGMALIFHPDFLYDTPLANLINRYSFFSYSSNEALHMSDKEKETIIHCFREIQTELENSIDRHTKHIVCSHIETFLNYCERFYDRQFITREISNQSILKRFQNYISDYFNSGNPNLEGIPNISQCAAKFRLSPNYFSDLVKKESGMTPQEFIHNYIVGLVKRDLLNSNLSVSEIAYSLGFKYPHHLTRLFKKVTGLTPNQYKSEILN